MALATRSRLVYIAGLPPLCLCLSLSFLSLSFFVSFLSLSFLFTYQLRLVFRPSHTVRPAHLCVTPFTSAPARARLHAGTSVPALLSRVRPRPGAPAPVPSCPPPRPYFCPRPSRLHTPSSSAVILAFLRRRPLSSSAVVPCHPPPSSLVILRPVLPRPVPPHLAPLRLTPSPHHHTQRPPIALLHALESCPFR